MSVKSLARAANNRATKHITEINAQASPYAALRRALEWVMSEARQLDRTEVDTWTDRIAAVAREMNERSRP